MISADHPRAVALVTLIGGCARALAADIEAVAPGPVWTDELRTMIAAELDSAIACRVAAIVDGLLRAHREARR